MALISNISQESHHAHQLQSESSGLKRPRSNPHNLRKPRSNSEGSFSDSSSSSEESSSLDQRLSNDSSNNSFAAAVSPSPPRRRGRRGGKRAQKQHAAVAAREQAVTPQEQARYVAMDCEMVGVGQDGRSSALARVVLIDWQGEVLLDEFIRPDRPVTDYRTFVSGITQDDLYGEQALDLEACRTKVAALLQDKILIGHALKNDLQALNIRHPWYLTRDTAKYEPFMKVRFDDGILWPRKLRDLLKEKCHRDIQLPGQAHCPYEDALAALDLYKVVRAKWEKVMEYKVNKTKEIEQSHAAAPQ